VFNESEKQMYVAQNEPQSDKAKYKQYLEKKVKRLGDIVDWHKGQAKAVQKVQKELELVLGSKELFEASYKSTEWLEGQK
jgi:hypothetical protein